MPAATAERPPGEGDRAPCKGPILPTPGRRIRLRIQHTGGAQQLIERLADQPERQKGLRDIAPSDPDPEVLASRRDDMIKHGRLADPRLADDKQAPPAASGRPGENAPGCCKYRGPLEDTQVHDTDLPVQRRF
jgi:hypothetical protein